MMIAPLRPIYITFNCTDVFLTVQVTLLTFRFTRRASIKLLGFCVPRVQCDMDPTAEDFVGN